MDLTGFISEGILACVFFGAMYWVTKDFMEWRKGIGVVFLFLFVLQETVSLYGIYHDRLLQAGWFALSMLMILILIIGQRHDKFRIAMNYLTSLFSSVFIFYLPSCLLYLFTADFIRKSSVSSFRPIIPGSFYIVWLSVFLSRLLWILRKKACSIFQVGYVG